VVAGREDVPRKIAKLKPHFVLDRALDELIEADPFRGREMTARLQRCQMISEPPVGKSIDRQVPNYSRMR